MAAPRRQPAQTVTEQHAEWLRLLRPDGPFLALQVLTAVFKQGLDTVPDGVRDRVRQAWAEVRDAPDLLLPAWYDLITHELLRIPASELADGGTVDALRGRPRPHQVAYGPGPQGSRAMRLFLYRHGWDEPLTKGRGDLAAPVERAAALCRDTGVPLALVTNGRLWALVHARPKEATSVAVFDADLWLEEPSLLRAFTTLLDARRVLAPPRRPDGAWSDSPAALFERSAEAHTRVTDTLGRQVRQAVELLVDELARLDREAHGALLRDVGERQIYRGALTVLMRLVFLLYAEEQELLPVNDPLYAESYSVAGLYDRLEAERSSHGDELGDRRKAAWPRLMALFRAVHGGSEHPDLRIPAYGGSLFDPAAHEWLTRAAVTDRITHEVLDALLMLHHDARRRAPASGPGQDRDGAERLSYKGLGVEQIGHVYEGLLEFSCLRTSEPYLGLLGKLEPELPLSRVEEEYAKGKPSFLAWLKKDCDATPKQLEKALAHVPTADELADVHENFDNDAELTERTRPFAGLLRRDLRGRPVVFPADSVLFTQVGDRRATGTHYTPRPLAEEVVLHTLEPLCHDPGPAEGADPADWRVKPSTELLDLKIVDPAMGSGAFLVSACRYVAERVVEAWERDGIPADVLQVLGPSYDPDGLLNMAKRRVAASCVYGVDRDDMAVELAKLSIWIETLAADKPFSFLDHALRCGDSLVGLIDEAQVVNFHLDPERGHRLNARMSGTMDEVVGPILTRVQELREEIEASAAEDIDRIAEKEKKLHEAEHLTARLRIAADAVSAAALATATEPNTEDKKGFTAFDRRLTSIAEKVQHAVTPEDIKRFTPEEYRSPVEAQLRTLLNAWLRGPRREPIRPFHWSLEFPEVMRRGGFHAVVGNPPFIGGTLIKGRIGKDILSYIGRYLAHGNTAGGRADLCSYFLLRYLRFVAGGRVGIIATDTIAQGDSREVGFDQAFRMGWSIYRAEKSQPWPGSASLEVALVWIGEPGRKERRILNGSDVLGITSSLDPTARVRLTPCRLSANKDQSFEGCKPLGMGFVLSPEEASCLIVEDECNREVVAPYVSGEDLNSRPDVSASRWIIDFNDRSLEEVLPYSDLFSIVEEKVRPERQRKRGDGSFVLRKPLPQRWWQYADRRPALRRAIEGLPRIIAIAQTSRTQMPVFIAGGQVYSNTVVIIASDHASQLTLRSSNMQYWWTARYSAGLRGDLRFFPSDCFETLPQPTANTQMTSGGEKLNAFRSALMERTRRGLTKLYNRVHDKADRDADIVRLREIHVEIDEAVRKAYALDEERESAIQEYEAKIASAPLPSWHEIDLGHGFYETRQGVRFTISPQARDDVLDKLLALNHYRYEQEVRQGLHNQKVRKRTGGAWKSQPSADTSFEDGLFAPPDSLF